MPETRKEKIKRAEELYLSGMKMVEIAKLLEVPDSTVRRWKLTYQWGYERSEEKKEEVKKEQKKSERSQKVGRKKKEKSKKKEKIEPEITEILENENLTEKQKLFCIYYTKYFNATKAAKKAGYSQNRAGEIGWQLLQKPTIQKEIRQLKQGRLQKAMLEPEDIFQKFMDIAFSDITDYIRFGQEEVPIMGAFGPIQVKEEQTGEKKTLMGKVNVVWLEESDAVDGTIVTEVSHGKQGTKVKLADRMRALEWLANHMDTFATEEQKARIAKLKAETERIKGEAEEAETESDGFLEALQAEGEKVWEEE